MLYSDPQWVGCEETKPPTAPLIVPEMTSSYNSVLGTDTADSLNGTTGADSISALQGNDTIDGKGGADLLFGGAENDTITTSAASNSAKFTGNQGNDTLSIGQLSSNSILLRRRR